MNSKPATNRLSLALGTFLTAASLLCASALQAQERAWPWKPVRVVLTSGAGNVTDANTRLLAASLSNLWGQPVIVENKPGANGSIGAAYVIGQGNDGHTLLATTTALVQTLAVRKKLPYDVFNDLAPISQVFIVRIVFAVAANLPVTTLADFVNLAKANPGKYSFGSFGVGSTAHMVIEKINLDSKSKILHVPYQGSPPAIRALLAGEVQSTLGDLFLLKQHQDAGKVKILASTGGKRSPYSPEIPTFEQSGVPGFNVDNWAAWFAPAGTPESVLEKIAADLKKVQALPEVQAGYAKQGVEVANNTPAQMRKMLRDDYVYWNGLVDSIGLKPE